MAVCKHCGVPFDWGNTGNRWVPLIPQGAEGTVARRYVDSDGVLRAAHNDVCTREPGTPTVWVQKLAEPISVDVAGDQS